MRRNSKDYIPTIAELMSEEEERKARVAQSGIKMKTYKMSYTINGTPMTERVCAMTQAQAIETCKAQCSMVGWVPYGLQAEEEVA